MADRLFWVALRRVWPRWSECLAIVKPQTVIAWHRKGFKLFWRWKSRGAGRPKTSLVIRNLIREMSRDNPRWGSPRILGELEKLGFFLSQTTVERYMCKPRRPPSPTWKTFLRNESKAICACDFFVVPTITFHLLFVFVVLSHDRRKLLHFNVTSSPTSEWTGQQIVNAFPYDTAPKFLIRDNDSIYGRYFDKCVNGLGIRQIRTAFKAPKMNGLCERVIGTLRRECTNHVIVFGENHLRRILREYVEYYNKHRTHMSLGRDSPEHREIERPIDGKIRKIPILGGFHHRYTRKAA
jgi:transposase InsO family protein